MDTNSIFDSITSQITENDVVLYMKGTSDAPQCGFSASVAKLLTQLEVPYLSVNVLESQELREGIKQYTDWPTIPQLYVKGEFIGGYDIVKEMHENGELVQLLEDNNIISQQDEALS